MILGMVVGAVAALSVVGAVVGVCEARRRQVAALLEDVWPLAFMAFLAEHDNGR